jgi:hypothetical protein
MSRCYYGEKCQNLIDSMICPACLGDLILLGKPDTHYCPSEDTFWVKSKEVE